MDKIDITLRFKTFAEIECKGSSDLYESLSLDISEDDDLLYLCTNAREGQPIPNLLFGAVHYLLLKGKDHHLKNYYPSLTSQPKDTIDAFRFFKDFCKVYRDEIVSILKQKRVQTNEVRRCAYLYPVFCFIYNQVDMPLSLIEIGTSAGLQLLWDKYRYSYGTTETYGDDHSNVHINSEIKSNQLPPLLSNSPPVASKIGIDLHISDLTNPDDALWLRSLIWPEHYERCALFESAAACFRDNPVELIEGDAVALLAEVANNQPSNTAICIFHTHVGNQLSDEAKEDLQNKIRHLGQQRSVFHIYNNMWDRKLHLDYIIDGVEHHHIIGKTDGHGSWFEWQLDETIQDSKISMENKE